jgi:ATP-dependent RNA helicase DeaD
MNTFESLGLSEASLEIIKKRGFEEPTEIQAKTIPHLLQSSGDLIAKAQTGTGKTAAFGLVFIEKLQHTKGAPTALVLTPTRELAVQVAEEIHSFNIHGNLRIVPVYGGQSVSFQTKQIRRGADIIVGTPGRILDHLERGTLDFSELIYTVLDEADEMLNMGFIDDIEEILGHCNDERQMLLFSATMPGRIMQLAGKFMSDHTLIKTEKADMTQSLVDQIYFEVRRRDKFEALCRIIDIEEEFYGIVFCRTKVDVDTIADKLSSRSYNAEPLHGDISQNQRERTLRNFKSKKTMILVATDVAARGIDVENLTHVINYSLPYDPESYVHRIGRTGRAGKEGTAITFVTPDEYRKLHYIRKQVGSEIRKEKVPGVDDIISIKEERIIGQLKEIADSVDLGRYDKIVNLLTESIDPRTALTALVHYTFRDDLDSSSYSSIKESGTRSRRDSGDFQDVGSTTRLFITIGKKDGMDPRKFVNFIEKETGVPSAKIQNIELFDVFSFLTVPFRDAELILNKLHKKQRRGMRIVVEKAADKSSRKKRQKRKKK